MRLINVATRAIHEFSGDRIPLYAILSHTWGEDEDQITFQYMHDLDENVKAKPGFKEIDGVC
ncbi:hypothetical protein ANO14919_078800 [Xylariales sp. No.14919]|nr:hypothetical protein ANO14919_078800 [Xylariales sp. No.14919]